jgi:hypothetical protein
VFKLEVKSFMREVEVRTSRFVGVNDPLFLQLLGSVEAMHDTVALLEFTMVRTAGSGLFRYGFKLSDNREWRQDVEFQGDSDADPAMTFDVSDKFKVSEFTLRRPVRDASVALHNAFGLEKLEVKYLGG